MRTRRRHPSYSRRRREAPFGAFFRRLAFRVGKAKAITATPRTLAILVYRTLKREIIYADPGAAAYDQQRRDAILRRPP